MKDERVNGRNCWGKSVEFSKSRSNPVIFVEKHKFKMSTIRMSRNKATVQKGQKGRGGLSLHSSVSLCFKPALMEPQGLPGGRVGLALIIDRPEGGVRHKNGE